MGHKVHPNGFRLGVIRGWESRWYAGRTYKDLVKEDHVLRQFIRKRLANAGVSRVEIERVAGTQISVTLHTAKPGMVIGRNGESVERLRQALEQLTKKKVRLSIQEIHNPETDAFLIGRSIAEQIEKRVSFRRAMKQAVQKAMRQNAKGIKVIIAGRLGGAEIARTEKEVEGSVPLQTLRANIDYGQTEAHTTYGVIGIKVWVYNGDVLPSRQRTEGLNASRLEPAGMPSGGQPGERQHRAEGRPTRSGPGRPAGRPAGDRPARPAGERAPRASRSGTTRTASTTGPRAASRTEQAPVVSESASASAPAAETGSKPETESGTGE